VSLLVSAVVFNWWSENILVNALGLLISFALSVILGRQMHLHIENQEPTWTRCLKWTATFVASCMGVMLLG
jgi:hypothetical protein